MALDGNGNIDTGDYSVWRTNFGSTAGSGTGASASAAIPEPASLVLLVMGMLTSLAVQRAARKKHLSS